MCNGKNTRLSILIADDHHLVRQGLRSLINQSQDQYQIDDVATGEQAWQFIFEKEPDLAILDIAMGELSGLMVCERVKQRNLNTRIIFLSMHEDLKIVDRAFEIGADAYLSKSEAFDTLNQALKQVVIGKTFISPSLQAKLKQYQTEKEHHSLTSREKQIISYITLGHTNRQIADILCISVKTVDNHRTRAMKKIGVKKTAELVAYAIKERLEV
ncbi:response regulator transcription factor [Pseudoalteromonas umbrosa]|uniref:response regulator transcription factor n=1 Tax=Pseudoalteromonas umbrosa TaxID=3048489 RepID=UPI0024C3DB44|nr:response regulator transcription factor [Pseudoalteromonas sp. B95]MDK1288188.1 response regulator transcription factor [Pseudoalteromonas sp. B95]